VNFCPLTEARFHSNRKGNTNSVLPYYLGQLKYLAEMKSCKTPPETWHRQACLDVLNKLKICVETPSAIQRYKYVKHTYDRYNSSILLDTSFINKTVSQANETLRRLDLEFSSTLFEHNQVNQNVLRSILPNQLLAKWPKQYSRLGGEELATDKSSLKNVDHDIARAIISFRGAFKAKHLQYLKVDKFGKHRFWANPLGTITGRDKPVGASLMYVPDYFREKLILAEDDHVLILLDYCQQEVLVAASLADDTDNIAEYSKGDFYNSFDADNLSRGKQKKLILGYQFGQRLTVHEMGDTGLHSQLEQRFSKINDYLDNRTTQAYAERLIACDDWQMHVEQQNPLTVRNWPVQATAASILRKACLKLDEAKIPVLAAFHDAVLIKCALNQEQSTIQTASNLMIQASNEILVNASLRVSVASKYYSGGTNGK
tara:strand:+ start:11291 stop:12577 length:1287 start_codon:yes stop_codon:yes gene_type:complete